MATLPSMSVGPLIEVEKKRSNETGRQLLEKDMRHRKLPHLNPRAASFTSVGRQSPPVALKPLNPTAAPFKALSPNVSVLSPIEEKQADVHHPEEGKGKEKESDKPLEMQDVLKKSVHDIVQLVESGSLGHLGLDKRALDDVAPHIEQFWNEATRPGSTPAQQKAAVGQKLWPILKADELVPSKQRVSTLFDPNWHSAPETGLAVANSLLVVLEQDHGHLGR